MKHITMSAISVIVALAAGSALAADKPAQPTGNPFSGATQAAVQNPAGGPPAGAPGGRMFEETDTNHDGVVSKDEWRAKGDHMFDEIDANHDGKLSPEEIKAHHEAMREKFREHREERRGQMMDMKSGSPMGTPTTPAPVKQ